MDSVNSTVAAADSLDTCSRAGYLSDTSVVLIIVLFWVCLILCLLMASILRAFRCSTLRQQDNRSTLSIRPGMLPHGAEPASYLPPPYSSLSAPKSPSLSSSPLMALWTSLVEDSREMDGNSSESDGVYLSGSSSAIFAHGTMFLVIQAWSLWTLALIIHYVDCIDSPPSATGSVSPASFGTIFPWFLYGILVLYNSCTIISWLTLLRNLWGGRGGILDRVPTDLFLILALVLLLLPIVLLGNAVMASIRSMQKCCCNSVLEKEGNERVGVEMVGMGEEMND